MINVTSSRPCKHDDVGCTEARHCDHTLRFLRMDLDLHKWKRGNLALQDAPMKEQGNKITHFRSGGKKWIKRLIYCILHMNVFLILLLQICISIYETGACKGAVAVNLLRYCTVFSLNHGAPTCHTVWVSGWYRLHITGILVRRRLSLNNIKWTRWVFELLYVISITSINVMFLRLIAFKELTIQSLWILLYNICFCVSLWDTLSSAGAVLHKMAPQ